METCCRQGVKYCTAAPSVCPLTFFLAPNFFTFSSDTQFMMWQVTPQAIKVGIGVNIPLCPAETVSKLKGASASSSHEDKKRLKKDIEAEL